MILMLGLVAFVLDTVFGLLFGKLLSVLTRGKSIRSSGRRASARFP
jgi:Na+-transporting methylmalonyl-CoA/oxaloacetate decarboxylase beta subunit